MNSTNYMALAVVASLLTACGGGGGAANGPGNGNTNAANPVNDPPAPGSTNTYRTINAGSGTSTLGGAILDAGRSVENTTGTITHSDGTFTASGVSGSGDLSDGSDFNLSNFSYATDVELSGGEIAIIGISTEPEDIRSSGTAAYTGEFRGQLADTSLGGSTTVLNWDADIQINFSGDGDVDLTFEGGGSSLIDTIRIRNATINGNGISGGTLQTLNNGTTNNITGTGVDLNGTFFGYNNSLLLPAEAGGAIQSNDSDTDISGVFITSADP